MNKATLSDETWIEYFTVELRMRDVPGAAIGDAVASVRELLADSGESAEAAFGTPREYAASLDLPTHDRWERRFRIVVEPMIGLFAFLAFCLACTPFLRGEQWMVSVPQAAFLAIPILLVLMFLWPPYLRLLSRNRWMPVGSMLVAGAAGAVSALFAPSSLDEAWLAVPPVVILVASGAVLVALAVISTVQRLREGDRDAIVDPLRGDVTPGWSRTWFTIAVSWIFPIFALLFLGLIWLMETLTAGR